MANAVIIGMSFNDGEFDSCPGVGLYDRLDSEQCLYRLCGPNGFGHHPTLADQIK